MTSDAQSRPVGGQDADGHDSAGTPRPDAILPVLDKNQLAALGGVGREWDRVSANPQVWRQALPVDPALGEYPAPAARAAGPAGGRGHQRPVPPGALPLLHRLPARIGEFHPSGHYRAERLALDPA